MNKEKKKMNDNKVEEFILDPVEEIEEETKKVVFKGLTTRYQMKKALETGNPPPSPKIRITCPSLVKQEIERKRQSYKAQDKKKQRYDPENFITHEEIDKLLEQANHSCFYCAKSVLFLYKWQREKLQWTLDRIDNTQGHNTNNLVISCLECNLVRRVKNNQDFYDLKNLRIHKHGPDQIA
jgi:hypothetical protein